MSLIHSRAMLCSVSITGFSARKLDKRVTHETNRTHGANEKAGRYNKQLLSPDATAKLEAIAAAARQFHYSLTIPWFYKGAGLLPVVNHEKYTTTLREFREEWEPERETFIRDFPAHIEFWRPSLNGMFNPADYPSQTDLRRRFTFDVLLFPVPDSADFRVDMAQDEIDAIKAQSDAAMATSETMIKAKIAERMQETIGHMADTLAAFKPAKRRGEKSAGVFRDSLVENVRELAAILPSLNVIGDAKLDALFARINGELLNHSAEELRESEWTRGTVQKAAADIMAAVSEYI